METEEVSWLVPDHPRAKITQSAAKIRETLEASKQQDDGHVSLVVLTYRDRPR